jgi:predicted nucleotidyltransferase
MKVGVGAMLFFLQPSIKFKTQILYLWKKSILTTKEKIFELLKSHKRELSKFGIRNVGLFGSYIRNEQSSESDIDLLVDFDPDKENFDNLMAVYDLLEKLFLNEKVEVVTKNGLSPYIGPKILKEVKYV